MADIKQNPIIRYELFTVQSFLNDAKGNLIAKGTDSKDYKISLKRSNLFPLFQVGAEIKVGYSNYMNQDYIATAEQTGKHIIKSGESASTQNDPEVVKAYNEAAAQLPKPSPEPVQSKSAPVKEQSEQEYWDEKNKTTRKSIERQKSLELASQCMIESSKTREAGVEDVIKTAKRFETYLATGE